MAHFCTYTMNGYSFRFSVGTGEADGIVLHPECDPTDESEFMEALAEILVVCPAILAYEEIQEIVHSPPGRIQDAPESFLISVVAKYEVVLNAIMNTDYHFPIAEDVIAYVAECKATYYRREKAAQEKAQGKIKGASKNQGYVYLIQSPTKYFKIGRTRNPANRMETFSIKLPFEVEYVCTIQTPDMHALEAQLHQKFASKRAQGEWFALTPDDVEYIKGLAT